MTTLRDDGYLETDDPVVAAGFLEYDVKIPDTPLDFEIEHVGWNHIILRYGGEAGRYDYPILVPASRVAEVECGNSGIEPHWLMLCHSVDVTGSQHTLIQWLRQHTQGEE